MNKREIIIAIVILLALVAVVYLVKKRPQNTLVVPQPTSSAQVSIEKKFNITVPSDVDKAELKDINGGNGEGLATRKFANNLFEHTVIADLPDATQGYFYEGWLVRGKMGEANFSFFSTGKLRISKGGYLLDFRSKQNYSDYNQVVITLERYYDGKPEKHILEGTF